MPERAKKIFIFLTLGIFLFYYSGTFMFYHSHKIGDVLIVHSHLFPLSKTTGSHTHTSSELKSIHLLSHAVFLAVLVLAYSFIFHCLPKIINQYFTLQNALADIPLSRNLRAPPVFSVR